MRANIKHLTIELLENHASWPEDPRYFGSLIDMTIGPVDQDGGDIFCCTVCSPGWFADNVLKTKRQHPTHEDVQNPPTFGRHYLFANTFDEELIIGIVRRWVESQEGGDWSELAVRLARNLSWEFEDFAEGDAEWGQPFR